MATEQEVLSHFEKADSIMFAEAKRAGFRSLERRSPETYFMSLCREVIGQQLSNAVAKVIFNRFETLVKDASPKAILHISDEDLRSVGMAWSKVRSIKDLAQKVADGSLNLEELNALSNEEIIAELTKVKGIGPWTAEMFLMFTLGREDVFSSGDLGLKRSITKMYGLKDPTEKQIEKISLRWKPYRTYACFVLWHKRSPK